MGWFNPFDAHKKLERKATHPFDNPFFSSGGGGAAGAGPVGGGVMQSNDEIVAQAANARNQQSAEQQFALQGQTAGIGDGGKIMGIPGTEQGMPMGVVTKPMPSDTLGQIMGAQPPVPDEEELARRRQQAEMYATMQQAPRGQQPFYGGNWAADQGGA